MEEPKLYKFEEALVFIKGGKMVARRGWNGKNMHIELQRPDENSKMTLPYIYMVVPSETSVKPNLVPWLASQTDLLADDWEVIE